MRRSLAAGIFVLLCASVARTGYTVRIELKNDTTRERQTKEQLERLLASYDLRKYTFTDEVIVDEHSIPHSHPVLTLHTRHLNSDDQLLSTRKLEANRDLLKVKGDAKLSDDQKAKEIAVIQAQLAKLDELEKRAEANPFRSRIAAFIEAETAGRQDDMSRTIAEFAAMYARTN